MVEVTPDCLDGLGVRADLGMGTIPVRYNPIFLVGGSEEVRPPRSCGASQGNAMDTQKLQFKGNSSEYFRVWVVNLLLSIVTLGIYSAWGKVRRKKYFYRNTTLDGHNFDFHADPIKILKGRLIIVPVLAAYVASEYFLPLARPALLVLIVLALPWVIVRSQLFNCRNTSYRNLRFDFAGGPKQAYKALGSYGLLTAITAGLAYPLFVCKRREFIIGNTAFGKARFRFSGAAGEFFTIYLHATGIAVLMTFTAVILASALSVLFLASREGSQPAPGASIILPFVTSGILALVIYVPTFAYLQSRLTSYTLSNTRIGDNRLSCDLSASELTWIYVTNLLSIVLSLGFLIPWATIRSARYRIERTRLTIPESLDGFIGDSVPARSATAEEFADMFDFDVGF